VVFISAIFTTVAYIREFSLHVDFSVVVCTVWRYRDKGYCGRQVQMYLERRNRYLVEGTIAAFALMD
jgi:hypothetical protein